MTDSRNLHNSFNARADEQHPLQRGWRFERLRTLLESISNGATDDQVDSDTPSTVPVTRIETISAGEINLKRVGYVRYRIGLDAYRLQPGDILFSHINSLSMIGNVAQFRGDGALYVGVNLLRLRPNKRVAARFLFWLLKSAFFRQQVEASAKPAINQASINTSALAAMQCPVPLCRKTQSSIAEFLDSETSKADELVAKYEQLIELLKQKRVALITHATTKGLDPSVPMKDSGIEWIGKVPRNWNVLRLKRVLREPLVYGATERGDPWVEGAPRYIRITDIDESGGLHEECALCLPPRVAAPYLLEHGDILFARSGATVGKAFLYDRAYGAACFAGYLIRARADKRAMTPEYVRYFACSQPYWEYIKTAQSQATIQNVNAALYAQMKIPVPSVAEQKKIISYLDVHTQKINSLSSAIERARALVNEHRSALITAAVTGRIDVTTYKAKELEDTVA